MSIRESKHKDFHFIFKKIPEVEPQVQPRITHRQIQSLCFRELISTQFLLFFHALSFFSASIEFESFMAGNRSRAAALETPSANLFTGQFFNAFSVSSPRTMPFVAEYQSRPTASKAPSKNLVLGLSKILARSRKRLSEMASNLASEALRRENRKEPNLGSMERIGPDSNTLPNGTRMTVVSNGVGVFYAGSAVPEIRFLPVFIVRNFATYHVLLISVIVTILL